MALLPADFIKGIDFTVLASASAGDHNTLIDGATPSADRGILLWSIDTALNTPDVPNAATTTKWKRYIWLRIPFAGATDKTPKLYMWNDDATSVATYLKWLQVTADFSSIQAQLNALDIRVDDLEASIATALATANAANATAATANINATAALTTATTANTNALQALSDLNTPTTGVVARVTALETTVAGHTGQITNLTTQVTNNTVNIAALQAIVTTSKFDSGTIALPGVGLTTTLAHGLGAIPFDFACVMVCVANDVATAINAGQLVQFESGVDAATAPIFLVRADATNVYITRSANSASILFRNIGTGVLTPVTSVANFSMRIIARSA